MSVEVIRCPSCDHQVRVPESLFGRPVNCPQCRVVFRAPIRQTDGTMSEPEVLNTVTPAGGANTGSAPNILVQGVGLIVVGIFTVVFHLPNLMLIESNPEELVERFEELFSKPQFRQMLGNREFSKDEIRNEHLPLMKNLHITFIVFGGLAVLGGISMATRRFYPLAWIGAIAGCLQVPVCCILGLPFGIWAMIKLADPKVRALFRRSPETET